MTYWFDPMVGGGGGGIIGGNAATGQPAMSTAQINASMGWNPAAQAQTTNLYGPMGFGGQTAMYAGIGAGYGRATGGFGMQPAAPAPAADPWAGTGFDPILYLHNNPDVAGATGGDPMKAYEHARSYGVSEGRPDAQMLPPITINEPGESWSPPQDRINSGFDAYPNFNPAQQSYNAQPNWGDIWRRTLPQLPPMPANTYTPPGQQQGYYGGATDFSAASKGINNPMNRVDWGASFGTRGGDLASTVRQWGAEQPGRYDPELDRLSGAAWSYLNDPNNADLRVAFGHDVFKAAQHAQDYGRDEGRNLYGLPGGIGSDAAASASERYFQANPDVAAWAGGDPTKAGQHYQQFGQPEGREGFGLMARQAAQGGGPGGQPYQTWNPSPMGGGAAERNAMAIALMNQGRGMNMPSGFGGSTYAQNNMFGAPSSGYLGAQGANVQDPFSGYVNPQDLDAGGSFPGNYQPRFNAYGNAFGQ